MLAIPKQGNANEQLYGTDKHIDAIVGQEVQDKLNMGLADLASCGVTVEFISSVLYAQYVNNPNNNGDNTEVIPPTFMQKKVDEDQLPSLSSSVFLFSLLPLLSPSPPTLSSFFQSDYQIFAVHNEAAKHFAMAVIGFTHRLNMPITVYVGDGLVLIDAQRVIRNCLVYALKIMASNDPRRFG